MSDHEDQRNEETDPRFREWYSIDALSAERHRLEARAKLQRRAKAAAYRALADAKVAVKRAELAAAQEARRLEALEDDLRLASRRLGHMPVDTVVRLKADLVTPQGATVCVGPHIVDDVLPQAKIALIRVGGEDVWVRFDDLEIVRRTYQKPPAPPREPKPRRTNEERERTARFLRRRIVETELQLTWDTSNPLDRVATYPDGKRALRVRRIGNNWQLEAWKPDGTYIPGRPLFCREQAATRKGMARLQRAVIEESANTTKRAVKS